MALVRVAKAPVFGPVLTLRGPTTQRLDSVPLLPPSMCGVLPGYTTVPNGELIGATARPWCISRPFFSERGKVRVSGDFFGAL